MSMANVTKTTRIQAIAELQKRKTEIQNLLQNGQSQDSTTIGGNSFTEDEWKKIIQKMDEYLTEVKQEQKERFEKRDKEKEIQQFYEKMKMAEQYKKPQAEKLTIQKHLDGEDIAPYSYLAEDGVITYNGVSFFCDYENNAITLGDMSDEKNVITVQLENGGCLKVNRDNIEDLSKAIAMFSPEDIRRILVALQQDAKVRQMQQEIEQDKIKQLLAERQAYSLFKRQCSNLSLSSGFMIQKRMYLLSKNGKVEQSRIIIFSRIARSNSSCDVRSLRRIRTNIKFPLGLYTL